MLSDQRSIDSFLEHRPEFLDVGKAAIASYLLPYETMTRLFPNSDTWYGYLLDRLPPQLEALEGRLAVVTFNYDRTLEHYLFTALVNRYNRSAAEARAALAAIPIHHVYGSLGPLPVDANPDGQAVAFGEPIGPGTLTRSASTIRIIHERELSNEGLEGAHQVLREAERVIFLGFGYDRTNLDRLLAYGPSSRTMFMGSAMEMTGAEVTLAQGHIRRLGSVAIPQLDNEHGAEGPSDTSASIAGSINDPNQTWREPAAVRCDVPTLEEYPFLFRLYSPWT